MSWKDVRSSALYVGGDGCCCAAPASIGGGGAPIIDAPLGRFVSDASIGGGGGIVPPVSPPPRPRMGGGGGTKVVGAAVKAGRVGMAPPPLPGTSEMGTGGGCGRPGMGGGGGSTRPLAPLSLRPPKAATLLTVVCVGSAGNGGGGGKKAEMDSPRVSRDMPGTFGGASAVTWLRPRLRMGDGGA